MKILMQLIMTSTIVFSQRALQVAEKHELNPTLGVIQRKRAPGYKYSRKDMKNKIKSDEYQENVRYGGVRAKKKALELNKELKSRHSSAQGEGDKFHTNKSQPKATSGGTITIGTNCSGMEAPIQAFRKFERRQAQARLQL